MHVRDAATGTARTTAAVARHGANDIAISPDGRLVATCHHDGFVCLRDPETLAVVREWEAHPKGDVAWGVSFGPGGVWLASAGGRAVAVWDTATGTLLRRFDGHIGRALSARFAADGRTVLSDSLDSTGLVWDVRPRLGPADARTPQQLWDDLGGEPRAAFRAVWLAAAEPGCVPLFRDKLPPVPSAPPPAPARIKALVADLDSPEFKTREAAEKAIAALGPSAREAVRKARDAADSPEVRDRLGRVLRGWAAVRLTADEWRQKRAVLAMELAGTAEARELLKTWAGGAGGAVLTEDARAALLRAGGLHPPNPR
jgi:hypothetical protein